jgi:hypothetical protein
MAAALLLGCFEPPKQPEPPAPATTAAATQVAADPGLWAGERMVAEISLKGVTIGEYDLEVAGPCARGSQRLMPVFSRAGRVGLGAAFSDDSATASSWLDLATGYPVETRSVVEASWATKHFTVNYLGDAFQYVYYRQNKRNDRNFRQEKQRALPPRVPAHDMHSALGVMRKWSAELGKKGSIYTIIGQRLYRVDAKVADKERITVGDKTYDAVRIDGTARMLTHKLNASRRVVAWAVWISDEPARLPLKGSLETRRGIAEAELKSYEQRPVAHPATLPPCAG